MKNGSLILKTASGTIYSGSTSSGKILSITPLKHIGENYFSSGSSVLVLENSTFEAAPPNITNFVQTCKNVEWKDSLFYCPKTKSLLTE